MKFNFSKTTTPEKSFKTDSVRGKFDLDVSIIQENFIGEIPIENKQWNIGVIYGNSGTGKSSIAQKLFPDSYVKKFDYKSMSVINDLPGTVDEITRVLNAVGISSPPSWLKPYDVLSNGEKMRVDIARAILENKTPIVFDEFTSVVDRNVAKIGSYALQKAIRKQDKKFIAVSCHSDIVEWLEPDWTFCTDNMSFFLSQTIKDHPSNSKFTNPMQVFGEPLGVITI